MSKVKKTIWFILIVLCVVLFMATTLVTFAYFSKKEIYDGYFSGEVELLFDRLSDDGMKAYQETDSSITVSKDSAWGTKEYPYVISDVRHLYNLSELQRLGYFYKMYIRNNVDGSYSNIPYFLVCTPDYTPALIDGTNFKGITSIGTDQYPFIGSIKGVQNTSNPITVNGKTCDTSALYNVKVSGNPANADVGLFGHIGFLGNSDEVDKDTGMFSGQTSTLSNLVLIDIQITVKSSLWEKVTSFLEDIASNAAGHRYSFTDLYKSTDYNLVPHENHHIGILAGHASYATIEYISVYYTSGEIVAIDLHDETEIDGVRANYLSATGILGFIDNINPIVMDDGNGNSSISAGSGDSIGDISYGTAGGGGLTSGTKSGYVLAAEMYSNYHYTIADGVITEDDDGTIYLKDAVDAEGNELCTEWIRDRILWGTEATGRYYFYDGVFTFALSSQEDVIEPTWQETSNEFSIGSTDPANWKANTTEGNNFVVSFVKEIDSMEKLQSAATNNQPIYIGYEQGEAVYLMSLTKSDAGSSSIWDNFADNKYKTIAFNKNFLANQESISSIQETLTKLYQDDKTDSRLPYDKDNKVNTDIIKNIENYRLISLGSSADLAELKNQYTINVSTNTNATTYTFKNGDSSLALLCQRIWLFGYTYTYSIWAGASPPSNAGLRTYYWNKEASVEYDNTSKSFSIKFDLSVDDQSATRYVSFNGVANEPKFQGTNGTSTYTNLKFYTVEGTSDLDYGRITFDPKVGTESYTFRADETVLFAASTHTNDANGNISTTNTSYTVMSLEELGWNNGSGQVVSASDLQNKFKMKKGITFGASFNLGSGTLGSSGIITAPVGTNGIEANIPQSCIAFRINNASKENKIRVIVSVAVSDLYPTEEGYDLGAYTRYFNLWKMEEAGQSTVQIFRATGENLLDRFVIPRSHPYEPGRTAADADSEYITVSYNGNSYRCYLNGDRVLIAYEFSVDTTAEGYGVGVYCLGMSGIDADGKTVENVPMEIVYFSAEGVASSGRDGASGSQIGTIDFVYDYENVIVTVKDSSETDKDGNEVYSNYYPSYCLLYFDTAKHADSYTDEAPVFIDVNYEHIRIRRYVIGESETPDSDENHNDTPSRTVLAATLGGDKNTNIVQYSRYADNVKIK